MPSKHIIPSCARTIQTQFIPHLPKATIPQFRFGVQALTLKPFISLASNARQTVAHPDTASTKMDRLVANQRLAQVLTERITNLGMISPRSVIACDHSDFNGLMAFVGAVQTGKGRALPVLVETAYSPRLPAHDDAPKRKRAMRRAYREQEQGLYEQAQQTLAELAGRLGFWPKLVFDRGFGGLSLIGFLVKQEATFYIRLKAGRLVELGSKRRQVRQLAAPDSRIQLGGIPLRVVRSDDSATGEPWYILTSDFVSARQRIIEIYYHRFEIEETFKDLKHVLDLDQTRLFKPLSLKLLLLFGLLAFILAYLAGWKAAVRHPKKQLSWLRQFYEALQRACLGPPATAITGGL